MEKVGVRISLFKSSAAIVIETISSISSIYQWTGFYIMATLGEIAKWLFG